MDYIRQKKTWTRKDTNENIDQKGYQKKTWTRKDTKRKNRLEKTPKENMD